MNCEISNKMKVDWESKIKETIQVGLSPSKKNCFIWFSESTLKIMKNTFYLILKALFVLKIFYFFLDFLIM